MENAASTTRRAMRLAAHPKSILILQTAFIGDVVLVEPLIARTKALFPRAAIDVIVIPAAANLLETHPAIRDLIVYDKRQNQRGITGFLKMLFRLRKACYDLALVPHRSIRSAALVFGAGIPVRIGFDSSAGRFLYSHLVPYRQNSHEVVRNLSLLSPFGTKVSYQKPELYLHAKDRARALQLYTGSAASPAQIGEGQIPAPIAIAPGSVWATKKWPAANFAKLGQRLQQHFDCDILLLGSHADQQICHEIAEVIGSRAHNLAGSLTLRESTALLQKCATLISNDSAPTHLGVAANIPAATIFGATIPAFGFYPHGAIHKSIETSRDLKCRPCGIHGGHTCPVGTLECLHSITVEQVFLKIKEMIELHNSPLQKIDLRSGISDADLQRAINVLKQDGVLLIPTETLYGLAASALSREGTQRIFAMKFRSQASPLPLICGSIAQVMIYCVLEGLAKSIAEAFWPGPLTMVLPATPKLPRHIVAHDGTVAVRVPSSDFCRTLAEKLGAPITATSANLSGEQPVQDIQFLPPSLASGVDLTFDNGKCQNQKPSTIIKVTRDRIEVLREGVISSEEIHNRTGVRSLEQQ